MAVLNECAMMKLICRWEFFAIDRIKIIGIVIKWYIRIPSIAEHVIIHRLIMVPCWFI